MLSVFAGLVKTEINNLEQSRLFLHLFHFASNLSPRQLINLLNPSVPAVPCLPQRVCRTLLTVIHVQDKARRTLLFTEEQIVSKSVSLAQDSKPVRLFLKNIGIDLSFTPYVGSCHCV